MNAPWNDRFRGTAARCLTVALAAAATSAAAEDLRIGMIGLDTSHVVAFTKIFNDPADPGHLPGARVVAAFKGGSPDIASSRDRIDKFTETLQSSYGVKLVDSIEALCAQVDVVLLESVDGRVHLEQARPVLAARKPLFIDKPMAASLRDALEIFKLARRHGTPVFSSSTLRFGRETQAVRQGAIGRVRQAETFSPATADPTHPDLFWYGIHGVESLFTVMGPGCQSVRRGVTDDGRIEVTGTWSDGRTGIFRQAPGNKGFGGRAIGETGEAPVGTHDGYGPMLAEILKFFRTGVAPVPERETIEILAFMEAADESLARGGEPVALDALIRARQAAIE